MTAAPEEDVVLKLLHTADWHLGRRFKTFQEEQERELTIARMEAVERTLRAAERHNVDAVLCAGDLFDEPSPEAKWWQPLATLLRSCDWRDRPLFLLPGNHDPLLPDSIWAPAHPFRAQLPAWVQVIDRDDFACELAHGAVLYARPCRSKAGQHDPTLSIPARAAGDERIRIGLAHGSTFDMKGCQVNFPIARDAAVRCGLDYLAIGDTHSFRFVPAERTLPPTIYPGTPEPTSFDEQTPGNVAIVRFNRLRQARVQPERVAKWTWQDARVTALEELRELARASLRTTVLRLQIVMRLSAPEHEEAEQLLEELAGTPAKRARAGILLLDRQELQLNTRDVHNHFDVPDVLVSAVQRLQEVAEEPEQRAVAERALLHLYRASRKRAS